MIEIKVDCDRVVGRLDHFWRSVGFTPALLWLNEDMQQSMIHIGAVPHRGVSYVRIHWLLDLVSIEGGLTDEARYDWSRLDTVIDSLMSNGLSPVFELMGNPSGLFHNFLDDSRVHAWRRLVRDLALHYMDLYGPEAVEKWYFETWNEPNTTCWSDKRRVETERERPIDQFLNYYDACSEGLKDASPRLKLGGPGTVGCLCELFQRFIEHCDTGTNYFTGETGVRLDFISVHEKGVEGNVEDIAPDTMGISDGEIQAIEYVRRYHPRLANVPWMNTECDPQVGAGTVHTWRARPYYAAFVCKVIDQHLRRIVDELGQPYLLLSHDNAFLGHTGAAWGQRTHYAYFGDKTHVAKEVVVEGPMRFDFIKKPVHNVLTALSLLGDERLEVDGCPEVGSDVGVIATRRGAGHIALLIYNHRDSVIDSGETEISLRLKGLELNDPRLVHYRIDADYGNPFSVWERMGAPKEPDRSQLAVLRDHQELAILDGPRSISVSGGDLTLRFALPLPSVSLIVIAERPDCPPPKVGGLRVRPFTGSLGQPQVLVSWDSVDSYSIYTYEVLWVRELGDEFVRINSQDFVCASYLHELADEVGGYYRVQAVDYWGMKGPMSDIVPAPARSLA